MELENLPSEMLSKIAEGAKWHADGIELAGVLEKGDPWYLVGWFRARTIQLEVELLTGEKLEEGDYTYKVEVPVLRAVGVQVWKVKTDERSAVEAVREGRAVFVEEEYESLELDWANAKVAAIDTRGSFRDSLYAKLTLQRDDHEPASEFRAGDAANAGSISRGPAERDA